MAKVERGKGARMMVRAFRLALLLRFATLRVSPSGHALVVLTKDGSGLSTAAPNALPDDR